MTGLGLTRFDAANPAWLTRPCRRHMHGPTFYDGGMPGILAFLAGAYLLLTGMGRLLGRGEIPRTRRYDAMARVASGMALLTSPGWAMRLLDGYYIPRFACRRDFQDSLTVIDGLDAMRWVLLAGGLLLAFGIERLVRPDRASSDSRNVAMACVACGTFITAWPQAVRYAIGFWSEHAISP